MILINRENFKSIYRIAFTSRCLILFIQFIANLFIEDHRADAYRNKHSQEISRTYSAVDDGAKSKPEPYWSLYKSVEGLTKWDSQYLLDITIDGYSTERHLAFLPLWPLTVAMVKRLLYVNNITNEDLLHYMRVGNEAKSSTINEAKLVDYMISAIIGVLLNNFILFPLAAVALYCLTKTIKDGHHVYSMNVVRWFCFNPAGIFFSACYTESLYALLTFGSMFVIEYNAKNYNDKEAQQDRTVYDPLRNLHQLRRICLPAVLFIALSTATRSNGIITSLFIAYQLILKYLPLLKTDIEGWTITYYLCSMFELIQDTLFVLITAVISCSGYIIFQVYSYGIFCLKGPNGDHKVKGSINLERPSWCSNLIPHPYHHVQRKYWNVGLFEYYQVKQLPNFILALPIIVLVLSGSNIKYRSIRAQQGTSGSMIRSKLDIIQFPYYAQALFLVLFSSISINVQVTTRLIASSCPAMYWIATELSNKSRLNEKLVKLYFIGYFVLGTILHANFFPWT